MNNLIVQDAEPTEDYLKQGHAEASFVVDLVRSGFDGIHLGLIEYYDLDVLDVVMVPGADGCGVLRAIRFAGKKIWDTHFDSDTSVIEVTLGRLLAKVDDDFEHKRVVTARGMRYFFEIPGPS